MAERRWNWRECGKTKIMRGERSWQSRVSFWEFQIRRFLIFFESSKFGDFFVRRKSPAKRWEGKRNPPDNDDNSFSAHATHFPEQKSLALDCKKGNRIDKIVFMTVVFSKSKVRTGFFPNYAAFATAFHPMLQVQGFLRPRTNSCCFFTNIIHTTNIPR